MGALHEQKSFPRFFARFQCRALLAIALMQFDTSFERVPTADQDVLQLLPRPLVKSINETLVVQGLDLREFFWRFV